MMAAETQTLEMCRLRHTSIDASRNRSEGSMRWWLGISLAVLIPSPAMAIDGLVIGLSEEQLLSCGHSYVGWIQMNDKTFYKFFATSEVQKAARSISLADIQNGCEGIVGIEKGKVTTVETKQLNSSLLSCFACLRLFSDCKYLRR
jgi:hypothetical protein